MDESTAELTRRLRRGEEEAFRSFYDAYALRLLRYLTALHRGDVDSAKDTLQAVFLRVAKNIRVFREDEVFWGWLRRVARTAFIDGQRKSTRYRRILGKLSGETLESAEPDGELSSDGLRPALEKAISALEPDARALLDAFYFEGLNQAQIAGRLNVSARAVEGRLARIRGKLRALLKGECADE